MLTLRAQVALLLTLVGACAPARDRPLADEHRAAIEDSVRATLTAFTERMAATDRDSVVRFYADDPRFTWTANGNVSTRSVEQIRAGIAALTGYPHWHLEYTNPTVVALAPGVGAVATDYVQRLTDSAGAVITFGGALTMVWIHTPGGWKILQGHSSSPPPPAR